MFWMCVVLLLALSRVSVVCGGDEAVASESASRLFKASKWEQAREAYLEVLPTLEGNERAFVLRQVGYTLQIQHQHEEALPYFKEVLDLQDLEPEHVSGALLRMGYSLRLLKRGEEGIKALDQAAELAGAPSSHVAEARLFAAWEHNSRGETDAALEKFQLIAAIPDVHANYVATGLLSVGRIRQQQGKYRDAIAVFEQLDELNPVAAVNRARARVYRMECEALLAGDTAFHIRPFVTAVSETTASVQWVSQGDVPTGKVEVVANDSVTAAAETLTPLQDTICHLHSVELSGLKPGTPYEFRAVCGDEVSGGEFRSAPARGTQFSFSLIGDTQSYNEGLQPLLDRLGATPSDFILHVGDITDRGNLWGEWKASFFDPGWKYLNDRTLWPVYGNHDGGPYFPALFGLQKQYWYSFDWGDAHFVILDSYGAGSGGRGRQAQLEWLKQDLEANDRRWTIVALHVPMVATRPSLKWFGEDDFLPILEEHEVDLVLSGHHPHYRRYSPIGSPGKRPILHVTSGGGGGPVGGYVPSPLLARGIDMNHFCHIEVDSSRLSLTAHAINGAVIDRFELRKDSTEATSDTSVASQDAKSLISVYQELLADRTFELRLQAEKPPADDGTVTAILDLSKLPRGPLKTERFGTDERLILESTEDSPWKMPQQEFRLRDGVGRFRLKLPSKVQVSGAAIKPDGRLRMTLARGKRKFEPVDVVTRIRLRSDGQP
jgi:hypothetical protein